MDHERRIGTRQATPDDLPSICDVLNEAQMWLGGRGTGMWRASELLPDRLRAAVHDGLFFLAECDGALAGTIKFQLTDPEFWPDVPQDESAFVHRLAVRRSFAGGAVSSA